MTGIRNLFLEPAAEIHSAAREQDKKKAIHIHMDTNQVVLNVYDLSQGLAGRFSEQFVGKKFDGIWHTVLNKFRLFPIFNIIITKIIEKNKIHS